MSGAVAASAAALALYYLVKGRRADAGPAAPAQVEACRNVDHAPNTWVEAVYYFKEVLRYMYTETFGRWHTVDLFVGLAYLSQKQQSQHPAADIASKGRVRNLKSSLQESQSLKDELLEIRQYMLYCQGLKHKKAEMQVRFWIEKAGLDPTQILVQQGKSGLFRPAYVLIRDDALKRVVLCIRGTQSLKDLFTSLTGATKPHHAVTEEGVTLGYSHLGMLAAARWLQRHVTPMLKQVLAEAGPEYKPRIIGHSMGAGTAVLLTMMLRDLETSLSDVQCVAIACPACMTLELANSCRGFVTTVINGTDIVPTFCAATVDALREDITASSWFTEFQQDLRSSVMTALQGGWKGLGSASDWTNRNIITPATFPLAACYTRTASTCGPVVFSSGPAAQEQEEEQAQTVLYERVVQEVVMERGSGGVQGQGGGSQAGPWEQAGGIGLGGEPSMSGGVAVTSRRRSSAGGQRSSFQADPGQIQDPASLAAAVQLLQGTQQHDSGSPTNHSLTGRPSQPFEFDLTLEEETFQAGALRRRPWPWGQSPVPQDGAPYGSEAMDPESDSMESRGLLKPIQPPKSTTFGRFISSLTGWGWGSDALYEGGGDGDRVSGGAAGGGAAGLAAPLLDASQSNTPRTGTSPMMSQVRSFGSAILGKTGQAGAAASRAGQKVGQGVGGWLAGSMFQACVNPSRRTPRRDTVATSGGGDEDDELLGDTDLVGGLPSGEAAAGGQGAAGDADAQRQQQLQAGISAVVAAVTHDAAGWDEAGGAAQQDRLALEAEQALWEAHAGRQASVSTPGDFISSRPASQLSTPGGPSPQPSQTAATTTPPRQKRPTNPSTVDVNVDGFMLAAPTTPDYTGTAGGQASGSSTAARPTHRRLYPAGRIMHLMPRHALPATAQEPDGFESDESDESDSDAGSDAYSSSSSSSSLVPDEGQGQQGAGGAGGAGRHVSAPSWVLLDLDDPTAYGRVKLCRTMVMDHFVSAYLIALDSIMLQLNEHIEAHSSQAATNLTGQ